MSAKCLNCGNVLPEDSTVRRKYCNDVCRVAHNRAKRRKTAESVDSMDLIAAISKIAARLEVKETSYAAACELAYLRRHFDKVYNPIAQWWKCDNCGTSIMKWLPDATSCQCEKPAWYIRVYS